MAQKEARFPPRRNRARCCFENQAFLTQLEAIVFTASQRLSTQKQVVAA